MVDFNLIQQLRKNYAFRIMPKDVIVSARKYENNSYLKVNFVNLVIFVMYFFCFTGYDGTCLQETDP